MVENCESQQVEFNTKLQEGLNDAEKLMAELKVDKILPATGSSISLSESGKTVLIPSGATLDASAATLTNIGDNINYCTSLKTSPFTASASRGYFINTGSAVTVTLPSSPSVNPCCLSSVLSVSVDVTTNSEISEPLGQDQTREIDRGHI